MDAVGKLIAAAKKRNGRVVLPEGNDGRVLAAARKLADDGIAAPILLGETGALRAAAADAGVALDGIEAIDPETSGQLDAYAEAYAARRGKVDAKTAKRGVRRPLLYAGGAADKTEGGIV